MRPVHALLAVAFLPAASVSAAAFDATLTRVSPGRAAPTSPVTVRPLPPLPAAHGAARAAPADPRPAPVGDGPVPRAGGWCVVERS